MARIYHSSQMGDADVRVALVDEPGTADLRVHRVSSQGAASGDALWYITRDRDQSSARIFICSEGLAQIKVFFVSSIAEAGWQTQHRLMGRF